MPCSTNSAQIDMGRHLDLTRWVTDGVHSPRKGKRVSAVLEAQFPRVYRRVLIERGPAACVRAIMDAEGLSLAEAWARLKTMCNS